MMLSILVACWLVSYAEAFSPSLPKRRVALPSTRCAASPFHLEPKAGTINLALTQEEGENEQLTIKMEANPLLSLVGKKATFVEIPCDDTCNCIEKFQNSLDLVNVACFGSPEAVHQWLKNVDQSFGTENGTDEEKRASGNGNVIAACIGSETARVCLETGRWASNDIYYNKGDDDVQGWADSAVQAVADIVEKSFWDE